MTGQAGRRATPRAQQKRAPRAADVDRLADLSRLKPDPTPRCDGPSRRAGVARQCALYGFPEAAAGRAPGAAAEAQGACTPRAGAQPAAVAPLPVPRGTLPSSRTWRSLREEGLLSSSFGGGSGGSSSSSSGKHRETQSLGLSSTARGSSSAGGAAGSSSLEGASTQTGGSSSGGLGLRGGRGRTASEASSAARTPLAGSLLRASLAAVAAAPGADAAAAAPLQQPARLPAQPGARAPAPAPAAEGELPATLPLEGPLPLLAVEAQPARHALPPCHEHRAHACAASGWSPLFPDVEAELREINGLREPTPQGHTPAILASELLPTGHRFDFGAGAGRAPAVSGAAAAGQAAAEEEAAAHIQAVARGWRGRKSALDRALGEARALREAVEGYDRRVLSPLVVAHASRCAALRCALFEAREGGG